MATIRSRDLTVAPRSVGRMKGPRVAAALQLRIRIHDNTVVAPGANMASDQPEGCRDQQVVIDQPLGGFSTWG
jgi:hypothetical protein